LFISTSGLNGPLFGKLDLRQMLVCYFPIAALFDEHHCRAVLLADRFTAGIESIVENAGGDP